MNRGFSMYRRFQPHLFETAVVGTMKEILRNISVQRCAFLSAQNSERCRARLRLVSIAPFAGDGVRRLPLARSLRDVCIDFPFRKIVKSVTRAIAAR